MQLAKIKMTSKVSISAAVDTPLAGRVVLIVVENLPLPFDRRVWQEANALTAAGASVHIISPTGKGFEQPYELIDNIHIYRHKLVEGNGVLGYAREYASALFHELRLAIKVYKKAKFDTLHACNPPDLIFLVALPFKLLGVKFIFDHHDLNPELFVAKFGKKGFFWNLMVFFEKMTFRAADVSIATNESYKKIAVERGGMQPSDVFVVRSGPDLRKVKVVPINNSWKNGRSFLIGYVGVIGAQEGIDLLLQAVHDIVHVKKRRDIQFCIVGGGPAIPDVKLLASELDILDFVQFTGRVSDADLFEVLSTSDVCVNPDRVNEMNDKSTMNKILEYMAFSKPIVQFDVTEGKFSAGPSSLYAKPNNTADFADKILYLIDNPDVGRQMGDLGRRRVEDELNWDRQIAPLINAYVSATATKGN